MFNDRLWPDFIGMSGPKTQFLKLSELTAGQPVEIEGIRYTPVPVNHVVPTVGYLIQDDHSTVVLATDTGPTDAIWQHANVAANLKTVLLETTFPNNMQWLADASKHLTPATFLEETRKLTRPVPMQVMHLKPRFHNQVIAELRSLGLPQLDIMEYGKAYHF